MQSRPCRLGVVLGVALAMFLCFAHLAFATTYYVDSIGGLDTNSGTSSSTPWQTIAKVNSSTFNPGDNILFKAGDTWREQLTVTSSGASGTPITFSSYGSGVQPIINGANLFSSSTSWTNSVGGSVSRANMELSLASGTAFVDFNASGTLTPYIGDQLTITDSSGHQLIGWIKAAGTGQTYGSQLLSNTSFATTTGLYADGDITLSSVSSGGQSGGSYLKITSVSGWGDADESMTAPTGSLLFASTYLMRGTGYDEYFSLGQWGGSYNTYASTTLVNPASWTQYSLYATTDMASIALDMYGEFAAGGTELFDTASTEQVLTPSTTGVTIVSSSGGSNYNWTSEVSGFNVNDPNGYTYAISAATGNAWHTTVATQPNQVFFNTVRGIAESSTTQIASTTEWYWNGGLLYVYATSSPATLFTNPGIEAATRNSAVDLNGQNYITISNLNLDDANQNGIFCTGSCTGTTIQGNTISDAFNDGIRNNSNLVWANSLITGNTVTYNGASGVDLLTSGVTNNIVSNNILDHNNQIYSSVADHSYGGGLYFWTVGSGNLVTGNTSYDNGILPSGVAVSSTAPIGTGLWFDTVASGNTMTDNISYANNGNGLLFEDTSGCTMAHNVSYANANASNYAYGISVNSYNEIASTTGDMVYNNTAYGNYWGMQLTGFSNGAAGAFTNNLFKNNLIYGSVGGSDLLANYGPENDGVMGSGNIYSNNLIGPSASNFIQWGVGTNYSTISAWQTASGQTGNISSNPAFVSTSTSDFALTSSSPAIGAGLNLGSTYEYGLDPATTWPSNIILGNENSYGSGWEIGAYVYTQTSTPSIAWVSPTNGSTVSSTITLSASSTAVGPASLSSLQFYLNGSPLGSPVASTSSPNTYSYSWNTLSLPNGTDTLYALATDNYGNAASSSPVTLTVANPGILQVTTSTPLSFSAAHGSTATSSRSITIANPAGTSTAFTWNASSTQSWLTFSAPSGSLVGGATSTLSLIANPTGLSIGTYNATATISAAGATNAPQSLPVSFTISTTGIEVILLSPAGGSFVTSTVTVSASATSTAGISSVQFFLDGTSLGTATSSPYQISWNTASSTGGSHTLSVTATDNDLNTATSSISLTVDNAPPVLLLTSPAGGSTVSGVTTIIAQASDTLSGITSVAFSLDGSPLATVTSSPYTYAWNTAQAANGSHTVIALATDGVGNIASTSLSLTVVNSTAPPIIIGVASGYAPSPTIAPVAATTPTTGGTSSVSTTPSVTATSSIQSELQSLLAELASLESQAGTGGSSAPSNPSLYVFSHNLSLYETGADVHQLQLFLISEDKGPVAQRLEIHGATDTFGMLTFNALVELQKSVGITPASGFFGPLTRAWVNAHE